MKVNVVCDVLSETGYASHSRGLITGLLQNNVDVYVETSLPQIWDRNPVLNDQLIQTIKKGSEPRGVNVMIAQPPFWKYKLSDRPERFFGFCVFEGDKISQSWAQDCMDERVTGILVPSEHTKKAVIASGVPENKIFIIPHGVDTSLFYPKDKVNEGFAHLQDKTKCSFLFNKGWAFGVNDRSGFDLLARAFTEEFGKDEPVRLIVHINMAYAFPGWDFGMEMQKLNLPIGRAQIVYVQNQIPFNKLIDLYNLGDFIVSTSKAEAFNLTILEGIACGLVPIVPELSGETQYVNEDNGYIYATDGEIPAFGGAMYEETKWRLPSIKALRETLRQAFNDWKQEREDSKIVEGTGVKEIVGELKMKRNQTHVTVLDYTWQKTGEKLLEVLNGKN